ncbi:unnamed protein product, partial [Callosobruchus maculatus]
MEVGQEPLKLKSEPEDVECEPSVEVEGTSSIFYNLLVKSEDTTNYDNPEFLNCLTLRPEFEELESPISPANNNTIEKQNQVKPESTDSDHESSSDEYEDEITCKVCNQRFGDEEELQMHHKSRRLADRSYKCCGCDKIFRDNTQLIVHTRKHTGEKPFTCKICGKNFSVNGNLSKHMRIHTGEKKYECDTCERRFTQFAHLEDHMRVHSGDRPYQCETCKFGFKTKARLRKHEKSHEGTKITKRTVQCPLCSKLMRNIKQLMAHLESQHEDDSAELFSCQLCPKSYKNVFALNHHMRVHGAKDFQCTICEKAFTSASHLRRHLNSHTGM